MRRRVVDFETVRRIGIAFPGVVESTMYGAAALKYRGKLLACIPTHRSAECKRRSKNRPHHAAPAG